MTIQLLQHFGAAYAVGNIHVAFCRFFRASELLQTKWSDITLFTTQMSITLQQSKTDPF